MFFSLDYNHSYISKEQDLDIDIERYSHYIFKWYYYIVY
jgi:hypothetical protein